MARSAEEVLALIGQWVHEHGAALKPRGADTFGEGMREAKRQVAALLATAPEPEPVLGTCESETEPHPYVDRAHCESWRPLPGREGGGR
ncbi:MAG TPA: hypothetical protein PK948_06645 [Gemmatimonadales bacterium]|nr:hypothetical protein [Gemmatimonadales bacterium]